MGAAQPIRSAKKSNHGRDFRTARRQRGQFEDEPTIEETLYLWKDSAADFADCLIGAHHRRLGCRATTTFDARAVNLPGFVAG